jgi:hypothetical protein
VATQDFMAAGDAALKAVRDIEKHCVAVGYRASGASGDR